MNEWQNLGIPFEKMIKSHDKDNPNPFEEADIVSIRSYQSLIASSIIGELEINPYSILLINDVSGKSQWTVMWLNRFFRKMARVQN